MCINMFQIEAKVQRQGSLKDCLSDYCGCPHLKT